MDEWNTDDQIASDVMDDSSMEALSQTINEPHANRFYDRLRSRITAYLADRGRAGEKAGEFLMFVPDTFILLWRLARDSRVTGNNKVLLGTGLAYYIFPLDVMPEAIMGPMGFLDDLVFGAYILNRLLTETDESILREHWSGSGDVLDMIKRVLGAADGLASSDFVKRVKGMTK